MKILFNEIAPKMHIFRATRIGVYMFLQHCSSGGGHKIFDHQIGRSQKYCWGTFRKFMTPLFQYSKENGSPLISWHLSWGIIYAYSIWGLSNLIYHWEKGGWKWIAECPVASDKVPEGGYLSIFSLFSPSYFVLKIIGLATFVWKLSVWKHT